jgi:hypothetical protein
MPFTLTPVTSVSTTKPVGALQTKLKSEPSWRLPATTPLSLINCAELATFAPVSSCVIV